MPKAGKFYCHYEDSEPNFTSPFVLDSSLTFSALLNDFCAKYNTKHGSVQQLQPENMQVKVGSKEVKGDANVAEHVSPGDDVYVVGGASSATNGSSVTASAAPAAGPPAQPDLPPIKMKVYVHYESAASEKDASATQAFQITNPNHTVGELIEEFIANYNRKHSDVSSFVALDAHLHCARTDSQVVVPAHSPVAKHFKNSDDVWIVAIETALKEDNTAIDTAQELAAANAIEASKVRAKDKSYYYWQRPAAQSLGEVPAPVEAPKQIRTRQANAEETLQFKTISAYSFVDDDAYVKVYVTMPGVGQLPAESIQSEFNVRSCSIKVFNYQGSNQRLQVPKLSEEIVPEKSSARAKNDTLLIRLCKVKKDHHWYELHKTKGIGED